MKCIKLVKKTHYGQVGTIKRIPDLQADEIVTSGSGIYVPKSEWKTYKNGDNETPESKSVEVKEKKSKKKK